MSSYEFSYIMEDILSTGLLSSLFNGSVSTLFGIASYVLSSLALYTIAKRRGLNKPWLAWIPVVNVWILGSLSDQYRYVVKGENKSKRKVLLTLNIINSLLGLVMAVVCVAALLHIANTAIYGGMEENILREILGPVLGVVGLCLPMLGVSIAFCILYFMALYDVYKSLDPGNCVLFLVLSILFNVTEPFFLFFNRNKDLGMPPRRPNPAYIPQDPQWQPQPEREPWENENKDYL